MMENAKPSGSKTDFAQFYNGEASHYDVRRFGCLCQKMYHRLQSETALEYLRGRERLLEAGCGTGRFTVPLALAGHRVTAFDVSEKMLAEAARKARDAGAANRVAFKISDIENIDEPDGAFDGVFSNAVIRHFPNPDRSIAELARVARRGAVVVFDFLNLPVYDLADAARGALGFARRKLPDGFFANYHWSLEQVRRCMRRHGLRLAETRSFSKFPSHLVLDRLKLRALAGAVEFLERSINWGAVTMVKGVKP